MEKIEPRFYPGDRVRLREDIGALNDLSLDRPDQVLLIGTKGSIGVIVSFHEFRTYYENRLRQYGRTISKGQKKFIAGVKETMEKHFRYPVKFEVVEPSSDAEAVVCCQAGDIELIHVSIPTIRGDVLILEKIE